MAARGHPRYAFLWLSSWGGAGDGRARRLDSSCAGPRPPAGVARRPRAGHRHRVKAAFVQGWLTKDEFDARIGQTFASRTYAELAAATADIPAGRASAQPPRKPAGR